MKRLFALALLFGLGFWAARFWNTPETPSTPSQTEQPVEKPEVQAPTKEQTTKDTTTNVPPLEKEDEDIASIPAPINPVHTLPTSPLPRQKPSPATSHTSTAPTQSKTPSTHPKESTTSTTATSQDAPLTPEAAFTVRTVVDEWNISFFPPQNLTPGQYTFTVTNGGRLSHNFLFNNTELGIVPPAQTRSFTISLASGTHTFASNRHGADKTMHTTITVQ